MLICHKFDFSSVAAVLQACHMSDVHHLACNNRQCLSCQRRERLCDTECLIQSYISFLVSNTTTLQRRITTTTVVRRSCRTHENCMHAEQIIIILYIIIFIFCSMYLVLFSIVLYRTIVTVYTDNIFLYNYLRQMHQIIHISPVGCFTPALGKTVQKNREVSRVKDCPLTKVIRL